MMTYNPRYYPTFVERYGFAKAKDLYAYRVGIEAFGAHGEGLPEKVRRVAEVAQKRYHVTVRKVDMRHFGREVGLFKQVYNDAWSKNWGFVPMTEAEIDYVAEGLKMFLDPDLLLVASVGDRPVGAAITLPDINQALIHIRDGRLFPTGWAKFLWYRRRVDAVRAFAMGVARDFQLRGVDALFYLKTLEEGARKGYKWVEMSWILEDNLPTRQAIEALHGEIYKTYRIYDLAL
jgi:hypothetical protein